MSTIDLSEAEVADIHIFEGGLSLRVEIRQRDIPIDQMAKLALLHKTKQRSRLRMDPDSHTIPGFSGSIDFSDFSEEYDDERNDGIEHGDNCSELGAGTSGGGTVDAPDQEIPPGTPEIT